MKKKTLILWILILGPNIITQAVHADKEPEQNCPFSEKAVTTPAPVVLSEVEAALSELKLTGGEKAFASITPAFRKIIADVFNLDLVKTKMEQFYTLLFEINRNIPVQKESTVKLDPKSVLKILLAAKVFSDPQVPSRIQEVTLWRHHLHQPRYTIGFDQENIEVPLNQGSGFYLYRNGLCQHAQKLIFSKSFSVTVLKNSKGRIEANDFKGADLFGRFGNRGFLDVDINFVSLRSVEFYKGTVNGKVVAYVSREEFKKNNHSPLLRFITNYVPDKTVQPIDW